MTGQDLKNSILQLAIQGKLVPQNPDDEPASVLLERIKAEKKKLIEEKKIKKEKPLAEITEDEKPFEIPDNWVWVRLIDLYNFIDYRGKTPTKISNGVPLITASNIKEGYLDFSMKTYISCEEFETRKTRGITQQGDLLFTTEAPLGHVAINTLPECSCGQRIITFQSYVQDISNELFCCFILSPFFQKQIVANASGMTATGIKGEIAKTLIIPLPPLSEQKRIVAKIKELMPLVDEYDKAQKELDSLNSAMPEQLKQSLLQEAIMGKLGTNNPDDEPASILLQRIREEKAQLIKDKKIKKEKPLLEITDEEKPFDIPDNWVWCRMADILTFVNGRAYKKEELLDSGQTKVLRVGNFFTNEKWYYSDLELPDEKYCYKGDLLYAWSASFGPRIWEGEKSIFHYHIWNVKYNKKELYREYLYYFLLNDVNQIKKCTTGSTMVHVSMENMMPRLIPLPPLAEQHRIVSKIENLFACIEPLAKDLK